MEGWCRRRICGGVSAEVDRGGSSAPEMQAYDQVIKELPPLKINRVFFQQELFDSNIHDPVVILPRLDVIPHDNDLLE